MGKTEFRRRSRAGLSALRRHRKEMLGPWSYALLGVLLASFVSMVLFFVGLVPLWMMAVSIPAVLVTYILWDNKTDPVNNTWGEGARASPVRLDSPVKQPLDTGKTSFAQYRQAPTSRKQMPPTEKLAVTSGLRNAEQIPLFCRKICSSGD